MTLEDQFEIIRKILEEVTKENRDIITEDSYQLEIAKLAKDLLSTITQNDLRENIYHLSKIRHAVGSLNDAIQKLNKTIKNENNKTINRKED